MSDSLEALSGRHVTLGVTGSIAAYKAPMVARGLLAAGATVQAVLTRSAQRFVGGSTFAGLTGAPALSDMWSSGRGGELHVELAAASDLIAIVPATADVLARLATGRADDLLTATVLCAACPVLVAPAMHPRMWSAAATQRNVERLRADGVVFAGPVHGAVASGDRGEGRMLEPADIVRACAEALPRGDLAGRHVVVTAGPTVEDIDPVRFIGNRSSGKMGFALAERAAARGARASLVTGPVSLPTPRGVERIDVRSALDMQASLDELLGDALTGADALLMAAAVGDYRPKTRHRTKLKRSADDTSVELVANPDVLASIGSRRSGSAPVLVGFAVETAERDEIVLRARAKLEAKGVDIVVANHASDSFGRDDNRVSLVSREEAEHLPVLDKTVLADRILDWVVHRLTEASG